jgi:hypothetical protein
MSTGRLLLLISILVLTGGTALMNLNTFESVLAVELNCDAKTQSVLGCHLGSDNNEGAFAVASAKTVGGEKASSNIGIDATESTFGSSATISENNKDNTNSNIESQIPSTISAIPFP